MDQLLICTHQDELGQQRQYTGVELGEVDSIVWEEIAYQVTGEPVGTEQLDDQRMMSYRRFVDRYPVVLVGIGSETVLPLLK